MRESLSSVQTTGSNVSIEIKTSAPSYWVVFNSSHTVVERGTAKKPQPFPLPPGNYYCIVVFGPAPSGTTASVKVTTPHPNSPFEKSGRITNRPTAMIQVDFKV